MSLPVCGSGHWSPKVNQALLATSSPIPSHPLLSGLVLQAPPLPALSGPAHPSRPRPGPLSRSPPPTGKKVVRSKEELHSQKKLELERRLLDVNNQLNCRKRQTKRPAKGRWRFPVRAHDRWLGVNAPCFAAEKPQPPPTPPPQLGLGSGSRLSDSSSSGGSSSSSDSSSSGSASSSSDSSSSDSSDSEPG